MQIHRLNILKNGTELSWSLGNALKIVLSPQVINKLRMAFEFS